MSATSTANGASAPPAGVITPPHNLEAGQARRYAQIVRENALLRRLLSASYEIQDSVLGTSAAPRDLVEQAEKTMLEVARDDRQKDFRSIHDVLDDELDKLHRLSREGT